MQLNDHDSPFPEPVAPRDDQSTTSNELPPPADRSPSTSPLRRRLSAAACMLVAAGTPAAARAQTWQFDGSALLYGERQRTDVVEPVAKATRLFSNGGSLFSQLTFDSMTGATPTGAVATTTVQTTTSASGTVTTVPIGTLPSSKFRDNRMALDLGGSLPVGALITATSSVHLSHEKDYQSVGVNGSLAVDVLGRLSTITVGGGYDRDDVNPVGGTPIGMSTSGLTGVTRNPKRVTTDMLGLSRILSRRWLVGANFTQTRERGYLTEPYKVVSVIDPNATPSGGGEEVALATPTLLHESRPSQRTRRDVLTTSVYHLTADVLYVSYRYYWDDWAIHSHAIDFKVRHDLTETHAYFQPHLRFYTQTPASFFTFGLLTGQPTPEFASSDQRLGPLRTATIGATYGFHVQDIPGELSIRAEYLKQWGQGHPAHEAASLNGTDLFPSLDIGTLLLGYTLEF